MTRIITAKGQWQADNIARQRVEPGLRAAQVLAVGVGRQLSPEQAAAAAMVADAKARGLELTGPNGLLKRNWSGCLGGG